MKRLSYVVVLGLIVGSFVLLASPVKVYGQEPTETVIPNTVTITAPPPYNPQVNMTVPADFSCPVGLPSNYGTLTPSSSWMLFCGDCLVTSLPTSTGLPASETPVWDGTGTPPATATQGIATLTPTVTVTPSQVPTSGSPLLNAYLINRTVTGGPYVTLNGGSYSSCTPGQGTSSNEYVCTGYLYGNDSNGIIGGELQANHWIDPLISSGSQTMYYWFEVVPDVQNTSGTSLMNNTSKPGWDGYGSTSVQYNFNANFRVAVYSSPARIGAFGFTYTLRISAYPLMLTPSPTPAVTATPYSDTGYCATISDTDMTGFAWTGISMTEKACFDVGPYEGFDWFGLAANPVFEYPWLAHICVQGVNIGELTVFGVTVSLHIMAYIVGFALFIRNMFIS